MWLGFQASRWSIELATFQGKTILITGASDGIGRALALELARDAPNLALAARSEEGLAKVGAECRALGAKAFTATTDVADPGACRAFVEQSREYFGGIDVLVNNAGMTLWTRFDEVKDFAAFHRIMDVNYFGTLYTTAAALPYLKQSRGLIVGVSSVAGLTGVPERTGYAASKHAMIGFLDSLRIELRGTGVDVTVVAPDFVVSQIHRRAIGADGLPIGKSPLDERRVMTAETCARLIRRAMQKRQRLLITSTRGRSARLMKLVIPGVVDAFAAKAIRQRY
jgi:short-subunit dehydrogenase